jgi:hypothetical protein
LINKPIISSAGFSGSYNDLIDTPVIPTVSTAGVSGSYTDLINTPVIPSLTGYTTTTDAKNIADTEIDNIFSKFIYNSKNHIGTSSNVVIGKRTAVDTNNIDYPLVVSGKILADAFHLQPTANRSVYNWVPYNTTDTTNSKDLDIVENLLASSTADNIIDYLKTNCKLARFYRNRMDTETQKLYLTELVRNIAITQKYVEDNDIFLVDGSRMPYVYNDLVNLTSVNTSTGMSSAIRFQSAGASFTSMFNIYNVNPLVNIRQSTICFKYWWPFFDPNFGVEFVQQIFSFQPFSGAEIVSRGKPNCWEYILQVRISAGNAYLECIKLENVELKALPENLVLPKTTVFSINISTLLRDKPLFYILKIDDISGNATLEGYYNPNTLIGRVNATMMSSFVYKYIHFNMSATPWINTATGAGYFNLQSTSTIYGFVMDISFFTEVMTDVAKYLLLSLVFGKTESSLTINRRMKVSETIDTAGYMLEGVPLNNFSGSWIDLSNKPTLFSGSYIDLTNKPTLFSGSYNDLTSKPSLFSGSYNDLTSKPTLFSGSYNDLSNKPTIPTVSTAGVSGSYTDLINKPTIPTVSTAGVSGSYTDLINKPTIPTVSTAGVSGSYTDLINKPTIPSVSTAGVSGSYTDLINKPTIPTVSTAGVSGSYTDLINKPTIPSASQWTTNSDNISYGGVKVYNDNIKIDTISTFYNDTTNLVCWYKFDGNYNDSSTNGYHLTNTTSSFDTTNKKQGTSSVLFPTTQDGLVTFPSGIHPYNIWNNSSSGITISLWFRYVTQAGVWGRLLDFQSTASNNTGFLIGIKGSPSVGIRFQMNPSTYDYNDHGTTAGKPLDGNWHHIVWNINKSGVWTIYYDNVNLNCGITGSPLNITTYNIRYMSKSAYPSDNSFSGNIDDFRIYNKVLTTNEISVIYNLGGSINTVATTNDLANYATTTSLTNTSNSLTTGLATKQNTLTAGTNITISGNTISASGSSQWTGTNPIFFSGKVNIHGGTPSAVDGIMDNGSLTIGDITKNYGQGTNWNANTAGLMMNCADNTEIAIHDSMTRLASLISYQGGTHQVQIGRDMGFGKPANILLNATNISTTGSVNLNIDSSANEGLKIRGQYPTIYLRDSDGASCMLHCSANQFLILSAGVDSETWAMASGFSSWPLSINMTTYKANFAGEVVAGGNISAGGSLTCTGGSYIKSYDWTRVINPLESETTRTTWHIYSSAYNTHDLVFTTKQYESASWLDKAKISGSTGAYTNFTGIHHTRAKDEYLYDEKYIGYIVSSTKKYSSMNSIYKSNSIQRNLDKKNWDALPIVELSSSSYDKKAFGVIAKVEDVESRTREEWSGNMVHMFDKSEYDRRLHIAGTGEGCIWVCNYNSNLECGDYITTSPINGIGMRQDDDIPHNYTVAKITMDCDFNPPLIPVQVLLSTSNVIYTSNYDVKTSNISLPTSNLLIGTSNTSNYSIGSSNYDITTSNLIIGTSNVYNYFKDENGDYIYTDLIIDGCAVYEPEYEVRDVIDINTSNIYKMAFVGCVYTSS